MSKIPLKDPAKQKRKATGKSSLNLSSASNYRKALALLIIVAATYFSYQPAIDAKLTNWDDDKYVTENLAIRDFSGDNVKKLLTNSFEGNYHPLTMISFAINYSQGKLDPGVYHRTNLFLHLMNTCLVFWFIFLLAMDIRIATLVSVLFGIHTLHVESVSWVSERKDVLYGFFFLFSLICYLYYLKRKNILLYVVSIILFAFSLLSKGMAVSLALSLFVIDFYVGRKFNERKAILDKIPYLVLAIVFGFIAIKAQQINSLSFANEASYPLVQRIAFAGYGFVNYLGKLIYPYHLAILYPYPIKAGDSLPVFYFIFLLIALGITGLVLYTLKFSKHYFFGYAFFVVNIIFVIQLISVGKALMADRYTYISSIGIFFIAGSLYTLIKPSLRNAAAGLFVIYSIFLIFQTRERCKVWHDSLSLWNDQATKYPEHKLAYDNRGLLKGPLGDYKGALADFNKVIELDSNDAPAYADRGMAKQLLNDTVGALKDFTKAIGMNDKLVVAYYNRAKLNLDLGHYKDAIDDLNTALKLKPNDANFYYDRGRAWTNMNEMNEAFNDFSKTISLNPTFALAYMNRGLIKMNLKDNAGAMSDYNSAIGIDHGLGVAYYNRGVLKYNTNDRTGACDDFRAAQSNGYPGASSLINQFCK